MKAKNGRYKTFTVRLRPAAASKLAELAKRTYRSQTQILNLLLLNAGEDDLRVPATQVAPEPRVPQEEADEQAKS